MTGIEAIKDLFSTLAKRTQDAAAVLVSLQGQAATCAALEKLGQGVLQQGQGAGLVAQVADDVLTQPGFKNQACPASWLDDGQLKFIMG